MHSFEPADAEKYGILEAVLLSNIRWWVAKNEANGKHFYDGKFWTYNSAKAFTKLFTYASQQQIQRALKRLEEAGAIQVSSFNSNPYDHTKWYTANQNRIIDSSNLINQKIKSDQSSNTHINHLVNNNPVLRAEVDLLFELFWKAYPRKTNKAFARKAFFKLKPDNDMLAKMTRAIEMQKRTVWTDKDPQYIPHPSTWLNGERWEDEVTSPVSQRPNGLAGAI